MGVKVKWNANKRAWYLYVNHNKKRASKAFGGNEKACRDAARQIVAKIKLGEFSIEEKVACPTLREFGDAWLDANTTRKMSTMRHYRYHANSHIYPVLGSVTVDAITRADVRKLITALRDCKITRGDEKGETLARGTAQFAFAVLAAMLTAAIDAGHITVNPTHGLRKEIANPDDVAELEQAKALSREQVATLLIALRNVKRRDCNSVDPDTLYEFFLTMARTGMRIGEVAAIQWNAVDFDKRQITVRRTLTDGSKFTTPKNGRVRRVDMSPQLVESLRLRKARVEREHGRVDPLALVFVNRRGKLLDKKNISSRVFVRVADALGYGYITPHILRHSFASQLLAAGEPVHYVQEQLGHSNASITLNVYGHFLPTGDDRAVSKLDAEPMHPARILHLASARSKTA